MRPSPRVRPFRLLFVLAALGGLALAEGPAAKPVAGAVFPGSQVLRTKDLTVEVMDPSAPDRYNRGVRFTPVAAILRVALGKDEFLACPKGQDPLTAAAGLFAEFDIFTAPLRFPEAKKGEGFVKIGVGVLEKNADNYSFWPQYPVVQLAKTEVKWEADKATYRQLCGPYKGYAYELGAVLTVKDRTVSVEWSLKNTGTKPIISHQYTHNSFLFNNEPIGPDYTLKFPAEMLAEETQPMALGGAWDPLPNEIKFLTPLDKAGNIVVNYPDDYAGPFTLTVAGKDSGLSVAVGVSERVEQIWLHVNPGCVCPEQFVLLMLKPGATERWTRTYTFGKE